MGNRCGKVLFGLVLSLILRKIKSRIYNNRGDAPLRRRKWGYPFQGGSLYEPRKFMLWERTLGGSGKASVDWTRVVREDPVACLDFRCAVIRGRGIFCLGEF